MYIILEIQANGETAPACLTYTFTNYEEALSRYFTILASAVLSEVKEHTILLMQDNGAIFEQRTFSH